MRFGPFVALAMFAFALTPSTEAWVLSDNDAGRSRDAGDGPRTAIPLAAGAYSGAVTVTDQRAFWLETGESPQMHPYSSDWFAFEGRAGDRVGLRYDGLSCMALRDNPASWNYLGQVCNGGPRGTFTLPRDGTFFLTTGSPFSYETYAFAFALNSEASPPRGPNALVPALTPDVPPVEPFGPDEAPSSSEGALSIEPNRVYQGAVSSLGDQDFYTLAGVEGDRLFVRLRGLGVYATLLDEEGRCVIERELCAAGWAIADTPLSESCNPIEEAARDRIADFTWFCDNVAYDAFEATIPATGTYSLALGGHAPNRYSFSIGENAPGPRPGPTVGFG